MRGVVGENIFGIPILVDGEATITDRSSRDLPLIMKRYSNLRREDIDVLIPDDTAWRGLGAAKDVYIP